MKMATKSNVELLIKKGVITQAQAAKALDEAKRVGVPVEKALERLGIISEIDIAKIVAESVGVPFMDLDDYIIDPEVIKLIPENIAKKYKVVPLFKIGKMLTVAMTEPHDVVAIDEIRAVTRMEEIDPVLSTVDMIQRVIDRYYAVLGNVEELVDVFIKEKPEEKLRMEKDFAATAEEPPIIKLVNLLIVQAIRERASDIHIEPEEEIVRVRYRIDGVLHEVKNLPKYLQSAIASRIKVIAKMDISETRLPQDGRIELKMENKNLDLRVSSFPTVHGENIVLRILDKSSVLLGLAELGFADSELNVYDKLIKKPNGIVLVTGPTGSGKTTTLYATLAAINSIEDNIITIEDPVEYAISLVRQTQINPKAGLTFASGLRSILRQDPDIIMVGEIRDKETAEIAIQASLTGHLVFSTLHTNDSPSALTRLIDMGIEPFLIASSVAGIIAQRLVRLICQKCKEEYIPLEEFTKKMGLAEGTKFYRGKGCTKCKNSGFSGRIGIYELLIMDSKIKDMVTAKMSASDIKKKAIELGMRTLFQDGIEKAKKGLTTIEEVLRVTEE
jgi:type IV pilus assembly protein PilB